MPWREGRPAWMPQSDSKATLAIIGLPFLFLLRFSFIYFPYTPESILGIERQIDHLASGSD